MKSDEERNKLRLKSRQRERKLLIEVAKLWGEQRGINVSELVFRMKTAKRVFDHDKKNDHPRFPEARSVILAALRPFPDAERAVIAAIDSIELSSGS